MNRRRLALTAVIAAGALAGACGSDGSEQAKEDFIAKGDAICARADQEREPVEAATVGSAFESGRSPTLAEWRALFEGIAPANANEVSALEALTPPTGDRARVDRWAAAAREAHAKMQQFVVTSAGIGAQPDVDALFADLEQTTSATEKDMRDYGFRVCGADEED